MFFIHSYQRTTFPLKYIVRDSTDAIVPASFYEFQMIKAEPNFERHKRIKRINRQKKNPQTKQIDYNVTFSGYPGTYWISEKQLKQFKAEFN